MKSLKNLFTQLTFVFFTLSTVISPVQAFGPQDLPDYSKLSLVRANPQLAREFFFDDTHARQLTAIGGPEIFKQALQGENFLFLSDAMDDHWCFNKVRSSFEDPEVPGYSWVWGCSTDWKDAARKDPTLGKTFRAFYGTPTGKDEELIYIANFAFYVQSILNASKRAVLPLQRGKAPSDKRPEDKVATRDKTAAGTAGGTRSSTNRKPSEHRADFVSYDQFGSLFCDLAVRTFTPIDVIKEILALREKFLLPIEPNLALEIKRENSVFRGTEAGHRENLPRDKAESRIAEETPPRMRALEHSLAKTHRFLKRGDGACGLHANGTNPEHVVPLFMERLKTEGPSDKTDILAHVIADAFEMRRTLLEKRGLHGHEEKARVAFKEIFGTEHIETLDKDQIRGTFIRTTDLEPVLVRESKAIRRDLLKKVPREKQEREFKKYLKQAALSRFLNRKMQSHLERKGLLNGFLNLEKIEAYLTEKYILRNINDGQLEAGNARLFQEMSNVGVVSFEQSPARDFMTNEKLCSAPPASFSQTCKAVLNGTNARDRDVVRALIEAEVLEVLRWNLDKNVRFQNPEETELLLKRTFKTGDLGELMDPEDRFQTNRVLKEKLNDNTICFAFLDERFENRSIIPLQNGKALDGRNRDPIDDQGAVTYPETGALSRNGIAEAKMSTYQFTFSECKKDHRGHAVEDRPIIFTRLFGGHFDVVHPTFEHLESLGLAPDTFGITQYFKQWIFDELDVLHSRGLEGDNKILFDKYVGHLRGYYTDVDAALEGAIASVEKKEQAFLKAWRKLHPEKAAPAPASSEKGKDYRDTGKASATDTGSPTTEQDSATALSREAVRALLGDKNPSDLAGKLGIATDDVYAMSLKEIVTALSLVGY